MRTKGRLVRALADVDLSLEAGAGLGVVGPSGSGKSTLLRLLLHLERPDAGRLTLDGHLIEGRRPLRDFRRAVQFVPQDPAGSLDPRRAMGVQVREPLLRLGLDGDHAAATAEAFERVGLPAGLGAATIDRISGGQAQRVAIARAIVTKPRFLIADEPVSSLDAPLRAQVLGVLSDLRSQGMGVLMVSHDLGSVHRVCDDVMVLDAGRIVEQGRLTDVWASPRESMTRRLIEAVARLVP